ncbi:MAG: pyridoxal phosphate-dependent aminotransferase [Clostridia bacterium]|nr:pyridoxal phosphate-dependent aminotransferase [Clostridia bacterium]MDE7214980.1 pyridoxal phosphate-dependent aminotransferase [Clostridia bacterium]
MINEKNVRLGKTRSSIRELFEYGKKRKAEIGEENVFDFSLGNPSVPAPPEVSAALKEIIDTFDPVLLHGYTSAQGDYSVRKTVAEYINSRFKTGLTADCIYMTCGAAASLTITLNALLNAGDEVITFAPYFPEYKVFTEHAGGKLIAVECEDETFQIDFEKLKKALSPTTKAVIVNSPNNPSGVVYSEKSMILLGQLLEEHSKKHNNPVYLISDEPYRELVYEKSVRVPYIMDFYANSVVCYSYSKSLSLPGERIGYVAVNNKMENFEDVYAGVCGAGRALGFVCAPNLFQQLVKKVCGLTSDVSVYKKNRDVLYAALTEYGYKAVKPDGAFYMFVNAFEEDAKAFCERAKDFELLIVAGDDFGCKGYARISYCVSPEMLERALPAFKKLAESYKK